MSTTSNEEPDIDDLLRRAEETARAVESAPEGEEERLDDARWERIEELRTAGGDRALEGARAWAASDSHVLRGLAADVLGQLQPFTESATFRASCIDTVTPLLGDAEPGVLGNAITALGHLRACSADDEWDGAELLPFATHPDEGVRFACCVALGGGPVERSPEVLDAFLALMEDDDDDIRDWATFGAGVQCESLVDARLTEALARRLDDPHEETRVEAIHALALRRDARSIPPIEAYLASGEAPGPVFEAIAAAPDRRYVDALQRFADATDAEVIREALEACAALPE
ncbi:MAG: hypothetical protein AAFU73_08335 [Planctomycetota bacterium]